MRRTAFSMPALALFLLAGCATGPSSRIHTHPEFEQRSRLIKTVALTPPGVKVYRLAAIQAIRAELVPEWSETASKNIGTAIRGFLAERGGVSIRELMGGSGSELEEVRALFEAVATSLVLPYLNVPERQENLGYSLGPLVELARPVDAEALLFVHGVDRVLGAPAGALRTAEVGSDIGTIVGSVALCVEFPPLCPFTLPMGALGAMGAMGPGVAGRTESWLVAALVDAQTGDLLWVNHVSSARSDLRDPGSVASLVSALLSESPLTRSAP